MLHVFILSLSIFAEDFYLLRHMRHDRSSFTQGLVLHNGYLYESSGLYGRSSLRAVDPETGAVVKMVKLESKYFAEGITIVDDKLYMLTYHEKVLLVFDLHSLSLLHSIPINTMTGEGWGLTNDGTHLIVSDGSQFLSFYEIPSKISSYPSATVEKVNIFNTLLVCV